jgi:surface polysaccharide O-acyltransferase-like enzyme
MVEGYLLDMERLNPFANNDFLIGTLAVGIGAFFIAIRIPNSGRSVKVLAMLGRYTLGIYAVHLIFVFVFRDLLQPSTFIGNLGVALIVLLASTVCIVLIGQLRFMRFAIT